MASHLGVPVLSDEEIRVLGCLVEKQWTTPEQYPLTLHALVAACNQTTSRVPVVRYDEETTEQAVRSLKQKGFARFVHPTHGRSVLRYEHRLGEVLDVDDDAVTLLAVLLLRGTQTPGELRARVERLRPVGEASSVQSTLAALAGAERPVILLIPRRPGQKEDRYVHNLGRTAGGDRTGSPGSSPDLSPSVRSEPVLDPPVAHSVGVSSVGAIEARLQSVEAELVSLRRRLDELSEELGMDLRPAEQIDGALPEE